MSWLLSIYIGATVFGVGVTLVDLFGLFGGHEGSADHGAGDHDMGGHDLGSHEGADSHDLGGHESVSAHEPAWLAAGHDLPSHEEATDHGAADGHGEHDGVSGKPEHEGSVAGHDRPEGRSVLLTVLTVFRNIIYFCLGFGPVGWVAFATSASPLSSLIWSVPVGAATLFGTRALRRLMRRELNSAVSTSEVLMEHGVVTVSIAPGELGKVRIRLGDLYVERFARGASADAAIRVGTSVRVTDVSDDCVYVEEE